MPDITLDDLVNLDACGPARDAFAARFPDGASYRELLLALVKHPCGIEWWEWLAPRVPALSPAGDAYKAGEKLLWDALKAGIHSLRDAHEAGKKERPFWEAYEIVKQERLIWDAYATSVKALLCDIADRFFPEGERHG